MKTYIDCESAETEINRYAAAIARFEDDPTNELIKAFDGVFRHNTTVNKDGREIIEVGEALANIAEVVKNYDIPEDHVVHAYYFNLVLIKVIEGVTKNEAIQNMTHIEICQPF